MAAARRFVRLHAPDLPAKIEASLERMTNELVTNAIPHARTVLDVEVLVTAASLVFGSTTWTWSARCRRATATGKVAGELH